MVQRSLAILLAASMVACGQTDLQDESGSSEAMLGGLSWEAEQGVITSPFKITTNSTRTYVSQSTSSSSPSTGGKSAYTFNITTPGTYTVQAMVRAVDTGTNSFWVNIDAEPVNPTMIWDILPLTSGFQTRSVAWRGTGTPDVSQFSPKVFTLSAGTHTLIFRGRESGTLLDKVSVVLQSPDNPAPAGGDTTAPTVNITSPTSGATVSGSVVVSGSAADDVGLASVALQIDTGAFVTANGTSSWSTTINTASLTDGPHNLTARATDSSGNSSTRTVSVNVTNASGGGGSGTGLFVSKSGSDSNSGTEASPWLTLSKAASSAPAGSTVFVKAGHYGSFTWSRSGSAGAPITFQRFGSDAVVLTSLTVNASFVALSGFEITGGGNCVTINPGLSDIRLEGNNIHNCSGTGIMFTRTTGTYTQKVLVKGNKIQNMGANGVRTYGDQITYEGNELSNFANEDAFRVWGDRHIYRNNFIHDVTNSGHNDVFQTWTGLNDGSEGRPVTNLLIEGNIVRRFPGSDAHIFAAEGPGHVNWTVRNNVFDTIGSYGFILGNSGEQGIQNALFYNNTFHNIGRTAIECNGGTTAKVTNNIFYAVGGTITGSATHDYNLASGGSQINEAHGKNADPLFANRSTGDFHITAGSPAANSGDNGSIISPVRSVDLEGKPTVGVVDIGAYELQ